MTPFLNDSNSSQLQYSWSSFEDQEQEQLLFSSNNKKAQESEVAAVCLEVLYDNFDEQKFELHFKSKLDQLFNEKTIIYFKNQPITQFLETLIFSDPKTLEKILAIISKLDQKLANTQISYFLPFFLTQTQAENFLENLTLIINYFPEIELGDKNTFGHLLFIQQLPDGFRKNLFKVWKDKVSPNFLKKRNIFGRSILRSIIEKINDDEFSFDFCKKDELIECLDLLLDNIDDIYEQIIDKPLLNEIIQDVQLKAIIEAKIEKKSLEQSLYEQSDTLITKKYNNTNTTEKEARRL